MDLRLGLLLAGVFVLAGCTGTSATENTADVLADSANGDATTSTDTGQNSDTGSSGDTLTTPDQEVEGCPPGKKDCGEVCVIVDSDPAHCGACDVECFNGDVCLDGECAPECGSDLTNCDGACVNLQTTLDYCGACDNACAPNTHACIGGLCVPCQPGYDLCGVKCYDLDNGESETNGRILNCGGCDTHCDAANATNTCDAGICNFICDVDPNLQDCNDNASDGCEANLQDDRFNCGACDIACSVAEACTDGLCTCLDTTAFTITSVTPDSNTLDIAKNTTLDVDFNCVLDTTSPSATPLVVHSASGQLGGTLTNPSMNSASLEPGRDFIAGERVTAIARQGGFTSEGGGVSVDPFIWQFTVATTGGTGSFNRSGPFGTTLWDTVQLADLDDGDGDLDVFAERNSGTPKVLFNDSNGVLTEGTAAAGPSASPTGQTLLGDLDGDGDLDAFFIKGFFTSGGGPPHSVWLNDGSGAFTDSGQALGSANGYDGALGDIDGDGDLDVVVLTSESEQNSIWRNDGNANFTRDPGSPINASPLSVHLADIDNDGHLDIVTVNTIALNTGGGTFTDAGQSFSENVTTNSIFLADLDGDEDLDVLARSNNTLRLWRNNGGVFSMGGQSSHGGNSRNIRLGDVDGDGDIDIWSYNGSNSTIHLNDGNANFTLYINPVPPIGGNSIAVGDLNGDGALDLVGAYGNGVIVEAGK